MDRLTRRTAGKRSTTRTSRKRGRYIQARPANGDLSDIALDATIRQAALQQVERQRNRRQTKSKTASPSFPRMCRKKCASAGPPT